jgi:hypothetical protein
MDPRRQDGQALPLALGAAFALIAAALALVAIAGAVNGKGRVQRAADLVAISAARAMRDDLARLLEPARLPDGSPDPRHLSRAAYLARAREAGLEAAERNGVNARRVRLSFPDEASFAPVRVKAVVAAGLELGMGRQRVAASAVAEAGASSAGAGSMLPIASGGGYSGPLVYRQGDPWA